MDTFAPAGVEAIGMFLGPLCTMVAQPETAAAAPSTTTTHIIRNIMAPLGIELVCLM